VLDKGAQSGGTMPRIVILLSVQRCLVPRHFLHLPKP
jgi:hypothetical protein